MALADPYIRIKHMRDHAVEAVDMLGFRTLDELQGDRQLQLALVQLLQIVGEAASPQDLMVLLPFASSPIAELPQW